MKKILSVLSIIVILSTIFSVYAAALADGNNTGYTYTLSGGKAVITGQTGTATSLSIPSSVKNGSTTYSVTKIGDFAFADRENVITKLTLPSTLTTIGEGAFSTNNKCTLLNIPANVTTIGARAFHSWVKLAKITFSGTSHLQTIGKWAFRNAQSLAAITFPDSLQTIGEAAFSYCTLLSAVELPANVTSLGDEAFLGCINLSNAYIYNKNMAIGTDAFDLTSFNSSDASKRGLVIHGYSGSTAKSFATSEKFTFDTMPTPPDPSANTTVNPPNAGSYNIKVTIKVTNDENTRGKYGGFGTTVEDSAGVTVRCKKNNGTSSTTTDLNWDIGNWSGNSINHMNSTGTYTLTGTAEGFPEYVYCSINNDWATIGTFQVTKLEVKGTSQSAYTTLWSGTIQVSSAKNAYGGWIRSDGYVKGYAGGLKNADEGAGSDSDNYINTSDKKSWTAKFPKAKSISDLTNGVSSASVKTDGTTYTAPTAFTYGTVKDQYSVIMNQNPTLTAVDASGNTISGVSVNQYRKLVLTPAANRASDYVVTIKQTCGSATNTRTKVNIGTFDYNVTFSYTLGTRQKTQRATIDYGQSPQSQAPSETPVIYDSDGHQTFKNWVNANGTTYNLATALTNGAQNVLIQADYNSIAEHTYAEGVESAATCTAAQELRETCTVCSYDKITYGEPAINHNNWDVANENITKSFVAPHDGKIGFNVYHCALCDKYCTETVNAGGHTVPNPDLGITETIDEARDVMVENQITTGTVPAPLFNSITCYFENASFYNYRTRGASLKADKTNNTFVNLASTQSMRFAGAVQIPEGVSYAVGTRDDNVITDFGFVFTQNQYINSKDDLVLGGTTPIGNYPISSMSVVRNNQNKGAFNGTNWVGVSLRNDASALTFNLVVAIAAKNWKKDYCARPYIKYIKDGTEYTVYDEGAAVGAGGATYFNRSVAYVAEQVVNSNGELPSIRNYFQNKVINHLNEIP